ncbi:hypothetical protein [Vreelandella sp. H-I2]
MNALMGAVATKAPTATLAAPLTLLEMEGLTICTQRLLLDGEATLDNVLLHQHIVPAGGFCFIAVPAAHMLALDLEDATITRFSKIDGGKTYAIVFKHYQHALDYLAKHYGLVQATDRAPAPARRTKEKKITISMMVEPSVYEEMKRLAELKGRSVGGQIRHAIKQNLRSYENLLLGTPIHTPTANASPFIHNGL